MLVCNILIFVDGSAVVVAVSGRQSRAQVASGTVPYYTCRSARCHTLDVWALESLPQLVVLLAG